jgi:hypothetical protein
VASSNVKASGTRNNNRKAEIITGIITHYIKNCYMPNSKRQSKQDDASQNY